MQTRYNLPIEILYTVAPVIMVIVFFFFTVDGRRTTCSTTSGKPDHTIESSASSGRGPSTTTERRDAPSTATRRRSRTTRRRRHGRTIPTLCLPVGETSRVQPALARRHPRLLGARLPDEDGRHPRAATTTSTSRPTATGTFAGKCAELCGVYHSRMLFNVKVVSPADVRRTTSQDLAGRRADVATSRCSAAPTSDTQAGLEDRHEHRTEARSDRHCRDRRRPSAGRKPLGQQIVRVITTTDHKLIGKLYLGHVVRLVPASAA